MSSFSIWRKLICYWSPIPYWRMSLAAIDLGWLESLLSLVYFVDLLVKKMVLFLYNKLKVINVSTVLQSCDLDRDWHVLIGVIFFNLFYYKQQRRSGKMTDSLLYSLEGRCHTTLITQILRCFCRIHQSRIGRDDPLITYLYFLGSHYNLIPPPWLQFQTIAIAEHA